MKKGYQLIEPGSLSELLPLTSTFDVTIALLSWLVDVLRAELKERLGSAELQVIRGEYQGAFPAIGIHYRVDEGEDLGPVVEAAIRDVLSQRPTSDFVSFLARSRTDWRRMTNDLLGPGS
jgi:hypothetical protein